MRWIRNGSGRKVGMLMGGMGWGRLIQQGGGGV